jgi:hypothetical protein
MAGAAMTGKIGMTHLRRKHETVPVSRFTVHFADNEIAHLERMIRSPHWHYTCAWPASYWRERIEELQCESVLLPQQRARLDALLAELETVTAALAKIRSAAAMPCRVLRATVRA